MHFEIKVIKSIIIRVIANLTIIKCFLQHLIAINLKANLIELLMFRVAIVIVVVFRQVNPIFKIMYLVIVECLTMKAVA